MTINQKLKTIAKLKRISQPKLAEVVGLSRAAINKYLNDESQIHASRFVKLYNYLLNINLDEYAAKYMLDYVNQKDMRNHHATNFKPDGQSNAHYDLTPSAVGAGSHELLSKSR